mgnify:CR=1 FL=1
MFKEKMQNLFSKKENGNDKKKVENIVVFIIILIITIIVINVIWNGDEESNNEQTTDSNKKLAETTVDTNDNNTVTNTKDELTISLESILSKISGVGNVEVMITYSETSQTVPIYNEETSEENTEETDSEGGTRKITQTDTRKEVIYEESDGSKTLITQSIISPKIEGAIITAEGANDAIVKTNIIQAVEAVTGLATHKIQVFQMSN